MLKHYFITLLRQFPKNKMFIFINILGFGVGLACCLMGVIYIYYHSTYDNFHVNKNQIYRVTMERSDPTTKIHSARTSAPIGPNLNKDFPDIKNFVRIFRMACDFKVIDKVYREEGTYFVDSSFFNIFSYRLLKTSTKDILKYPNTMLLTKSIARKYFGNEDPTGKMILGYLGSNILFTVIGVCEDPPVNSHLKFDVLISLSTIEQLWGRQWITERWTWQLMYTYIQVQKNTTTKSIEKKFPAFLQKYIGDAMKKGNFSYKLYLQPLQRIHLLSNLEKELTPNINIKIISILGVSILFALIMALVNYMNFAIINAVERAREMGIKRILGADKINIRKQILLEAGIYNLLGFILAIAISIFAMPLFSQLSGIPIAFFTFNNYYLILLFALLYTGCIIITGNVPMHVLSSINVNDTIKGKFKHLKSGKVLRTSLVILQFVITTGLIAVTLTMDKQIKYMKNSNLGMNIDSTFVLRTQTTVLEDQTAQSFDYTRVFKNELKKNTKIKDVTLMRFLPGLDYYQSIAFWIVGQGNENNKLLLPAQVDENFFSYFNIKLLAGRLFDKDRRGDLFQTRSNDNSFIINEQAVKSLGFKNNEDAINKVITDGHSSGKIIGVIKSHHFLSLHSPIQPIIYYWDYQFFEYIGVRINQNDLVPNLVWIRAMCKKYYPDMPDITFWLDDFFNMQYETDNKLRTLLSFVNFMVIIISIIGFVGLLSYISLQRTKEFGIRKVHGASKRDIFKLYIKDIIIYLGISNVIISPIAYYIMNKWLMNYTYRISIGWWFFVIPFVFTAIIYFLSIARNIYIVAKSNPADTLKYE